MQSSQNIIFNNYHCFHFNNNIQIVYIVYNIGYDSQQKGRKSHPALLLTQVRFFTPDFRSPAIRFSGIPQRPNPSSSIEIINIIYITFLSLRRIKWLISQLIGMIEPALIHSCILKVKVNFRTKHNISLG